MKLTNPDLHKYLFEEFKEEFGFNHLDFYFSKLLLEKEENNNDLAFFFLMYLSMKTRNGDICLDLYKDRGIREYLNINQLSYDDLSKELSGLMAVGLPDENLPVIMDGSLFYLNRFYHYEVFFASWIKNKSFLKSLGDNQISNLKNNIVPRYFPDKEGTMDWQKFAAISSCFTSFCAISGGPGTGKTTTIVKIIAILQEMAEPEFLNIKLCAPTGKAASRMIEALNNVKSGLGLGDEIKGLIPDKAYTIHRLLGFTPGSGGFRYNNENRLDADLVVVDEASMVDMKLMTSLCSALKDSAGLILLGDRYQLSSVSPGSVLGDICGGGREISYSLRFSNILSFFFNKEDISGISSDDNSKSSDSISDSIVELKKSYRFHDKSGIGILAESIKKGDFNSSVSVLENSDELRLIDTSSRLFFEETLDYYSDLYFSPLLKSDSPEQAFYIFSKFMILTPVKEGNFGIKKINNLVEKRLLKQDYHKDPFWYHGKPVMVTKNDYRNDLFNGDIGICLKDDDNMGELRVFFPMSDNSYRKIHPVRLKDYETVYSMTIHKSQGSEFDNVFIAFPVNYSEILSRELIYTGVTRARKGVIIGCKKDILKFSIENRVSRTSGLLKRLWG